MSILVNNRGRDLLGVSEKKKKGAAHNTQKSSFRWPRGEWSVTKTVRDFQKLTPSLFFGQQSASSKDEHHQKHPPYPGGLFIYQSLGLGATIIGGIPTYFVVLKYV